MIKLYYNYIGVEKMKTRQKAKEIWFLASCLTSFI